MKNIFIEENAQTEAKYRLADALSLSCPYTNQAESGADIRPRLGSIWSSGTTAEAI